jgi:hypothetical protein
LDKDKTEYNDLFDGLRLALSHYKRGDWLCPTGQEDEKGRRYMMVNITSQGIQALASENDELR